jgi:hypothetical protein
MQEHAVADEHLRRDLGSKERRGPDRRRRRRWVWRERRTGFDRRRQADSRVGAAWDATLLYLRDNPFVLFGLLALANVLSILDLAFTMWALQQGAVEANPVMAALLSDDPAIAAVVKILIVAAVSLVIYLLRRYRLMLKVALFSVALFGAIVLYHIFGALLLV